MKRNASTTINKMMNYSIGSFCLLCLVSLYHVLSPVAQAEEHRIAKGVVVDLSSEYSFSSKPRKHPIGDVANLTTSAQQMMNCMGQDISRNPDLLKTKLNKCKKQQEQSAQLLGHNIQNIKSSFESATIGVHGKKQIAMLKRGIRDYENMITPNRKPGSTNSLVQINKKDFLSYSLEVWIVHLPQVYPVIAYFLSLGNGYVLVIDASTGRDEAVVQEDRIIGNKLIDNIMSSLILSPPF